MSTYEDAAPNVCKLVDAEQFAIDFPADPPAPEPVPEPSGPDKAVLYEAFRAEYTSNGGAVDLQRLAKSQGVPYRWCEILMAEVEAARAVVHAEPE